MHPSNTEIPAQFHSPTLGSQAARPCIAFEGLRRVAAGPLLQVATELKPLLDQSGTGPFLIFDHCTSEPLEVDFRGTLDDVLGRLEQQTPAAVTSEAETSEVAGRGPGRPKLGVIGREVTLLPRHWDWLNAQPGGPSVTLRKLVEEARRQNQGKDRVREAKEAAYRFMNVMAGNLAGYEESIRVLFADRTDRLGEFEALVGSWPADVRDHALDLMRRTLEAEHAVPGIRRE